MKTIDEHYKDWYGVSRIENSVKLVHDSAEATEFAEYYHTEQLILLQSSLQLNGKYKINLGGWINSNFTQASDLMFIGKDNEMYRINDVLVKYNKYLRSL